MVRGLTFPIEITELVAVASSYCPLYSAVERKDTNSVVFTMPKGYINKIWRPKVLFPIQSLRRAPVFSSCMDFFGHKRFSNVHHKQAGSDVNGDEG